MFAENDTVMASQLTSHFNCMLHGRLPLIRRPTPSRAAASSATTGTSRRSSTTPVSARLATPAPPSAPALGHHIGRLLGYPDGSPRGRLRGRRLGRAVRHVQRRRRVRCAGRLCVESGPSPLEKILPGNPSLVRSVVSHARRDAFMADFASGASIEALMAAYDFKPAFRFRVRGALSRIKHRSLRVIGVER